MRAATMFSGIGAPEVAMPEWDWRWCAEIEAFPSAVHAHRHSQGGIGGNRAVPNLGDVSADDFVDRARSEGAIDVLIFGSPCQSFSVAGKRLGLDDPRGNLALVSLKVARQLRTRWLVFENVPGFFGSFSGSEHAAGEVQRKAEQGEWEELDGRESRDFAAFLSFVRECGYLGCYRVLDAQYAGVPQRRRRVFFVGYLGDWRPAAAVLFEPESLSGNPPPRREKGQNPSPTISARTKGGGGLGSDFEIDGGASEDGTGRGTPIVPSAYTIHGTDKTATIASETEVAGSLRTKPPGSQENSSTTVAIGFSCKDTGADAQDDVSPTLRAMGRGESHANAGGQVAVSDGFAVRRLTPRECERLQGFPDDFTQIEWRGKPADQCPDGPRYKALGNSMAVPVMRWILERIEAFEAAALDVAA